MAHSRIVRTRDAGNTLVETMLSASILVVLVGGVFSLMIDSQSVFRTSVNAVQARRTCAAALATIGAELEQASRSSLAIDASQPDGDRVTLQQPLSLTGGVVTWGARWTLSGREQSQAGAFVEYRLAPAPDIGQRWQLLRRVVDAGGVALSPDELIVDDVDQADARHKGFQVTRNANENLVQVFLRIRLSDEVAALDAGADLMRSHQVTIPLRNQ